MTKCQFCHKGLNSSYIRVGSKESFTKTGLYCINCDIYYSPDLLKQYTAMQKQYTSYLNLHSSLESPNNIREELVSSNSYNKVNYDLQLLYGPSRIRTNEPRHVKAVS